MLNDAVTIVTGGSRGLGRAMARALVASGGRVVITGATLTGELATTEAEIAATFGADRVVKYVADVTNPAHCADVVAFAIEAFGRLDGIINNAGRGMRVISETFNTDPVAFWDIDPGDWALI